MVEPFVTFPLVTGFQEAGGVRLSVYSKVKSAALVGQQKESERGFRHDVSWRRMNKTGRGFLPARFSLHFRPV